ncbi:MAG: hypothetical protein ABIP54_03735 [Candidatus Andersenbacteria bacterium]
MIPIALIALAESAVAESAPNNTSITIDTSKLEAFQQTLKDKAPALLATGVKEAFKKIGRADIRKLQREQLSGGSGLNVRSKGFKNSFKAKVNGKDLDNLQLSEYTGFKGAQIFETGGTITARNSKTLTILTDNARDGNGKRLMDRKQLRQLINSGKLKIIKTPKGIYIVSPDAKEVIAVLKKSVKIKKRLSFFSNFETNQAEHDAIYDGELEKALQAIVKNNTK